MNYIGIWRFHSVGVINESGNLTYLNADEYLNSPMPYIDETDEEAIFDEDAGHGGCGGAGVWRCDAQLCERLGSARQQK